MKLSDWLIENNVQAKDFAKRIKKSPTMVTFLKKATRKPNAKLLARISKATNGQVTEADFEGAKNEVGI